jgi:hypothetical protein
MLRFMTMFGFFGLGGGFLIISPALREWIANGVDRGEMFLGANEPWSGIGVGAFLVLALGFYMYRCSMPR